EVSERAIEAWARATPVDEVGRGLTDYVEAWKSAPEGEEAARLDRASGALAALGTAAGAGDPRFAVVTIRRLALAARGGGSVASWISPSPSTPGVPEVEHRIVLLDGKGEPSGGVELVVSYRPGTLVEEALGE